MTEPPRIDKGVFLSVVIPAYNEEKRIHLALRGFSDELSRRRDQWEPRGEIEILVVSDGSTDGTVAVTRNLFAELSLSGRVIEVEPSRGKGGALIVGLRAAVGKYRFFSDADLAAPAESLWPMLACLEDGCDVVIGTRRNAGSKIDKHQGKLREFLGHCFTRLTNTILGTDYSDFTCGFKGYTADAAEEIFSRMKVPGWAFDAEALFLASRLGFRVGEVPVAWSDVEGSKVDPVTEVFRCLRDLCYVRFLAMRGAYK